MWTPPNVVATSALAVTVLGMTVLGITPLAAASPPGNTGYSADFALQHCELVADGHNHYMSLEPGIFRRYEGFIEGEWVELKHTVLDKTIPIKFNVAGVTKSVIARAIEEREWIDGRLAEVSINYVARCTRTQNVYYLGEDVEIYEKDGSVSNEGQWRAGRDNAQPGLIAPDSFLLGSRYLQEYAPGVAMDRAEHIASGLDIKVPAGHFSDVVMIFETSEIEKDDETIKLYARGVGLIADGPLQLVDFN